MNVLKHTVMEQNQNNDNQNNNNKINNNNLNVDELIEKVVERLTSRSGKNDNKYKKEDLNLTTKTTNSIDDRKLKLIDEIINLDQHNKN